MKTAIVYCSKHNGNTKKVINAIAEKYEIDLMNALKTPFVDLSTYDLIGFASGIYFEKIHSSVINIAKKYLPKNKKIFVLYSCGSLNESYAKPMIEMAKDKECEVLGVYSCIGYYNLLPFKLGRGKKIGHPTQEEIDHAVTFYENLIGS